MPPNPTGQHHTSHLHVGRQPVRFTAGLHSLCLMIISHVSDFLQTNFTKVKLKPSELVPEGRLTTGSYLYIAFWWRQVTDNDQLTVMGGGYIGSLLYFLCIICYGSVDDLILQSAPSTNKRNCIPLAQKNAILACGGTCCEKKINRDSFLST